MELEAPPDSLLHGAGPGQPRPMASHEPAPSLIEGLSKILALGIGDILDMPPAGQPSTQPHRPSAGGDSAGYMDATPFHPLRASIHALADNSSEGGASIDSSWGGSPHGQPAAAARDSKQQAQAGSIKARQQQQQRRATRRTNDLVPQPDTSHHGQPHTDSSLLHTSSGQAASQQAHAPASMQLTPQRSHQQADVQTHGHTGPRLMQQRSRGVYDMLMDGVCKFTDFMETLDTRMDSLFNTDHLLPHATPETAGEEPPLMLLGSHLAAAHAQAHGTEGAGAPPQHAAVQGGAGATPKPVLVSSCRSHGPRTPKLGATRLHTAASMPAGPPQPQSMQGVPAGGETHAGGAHVTPMASRPSVGLSGSALRQPRRSGEVTRIIIPPSPNRQASASTAAQAAGLGAEGCSSSGGATGTAPAVAVEQSLCQSLSAQPLLARTASVELCDPPLPQPEPHEQQQQQHQQQQQQMEGAAGGQVAPGGQVAAATAGPGAGPAARSTRWNPSCPGCQHSRKLLLKAKQQCGELVAENNRLRGVGLLDPLLADSVCRQLESLLADKARLLADNSRLEREVAGLQQLLAYTWELHTAYLDQQGPCSPPQPMCYDMLPAQDSYGAGVEEAGEGDGFACEQQLEPHLALQQAAAGQVHVDHMDMHHMGHVHTEEDDLALQQQGASVHTTWTPGTRHSPPYDVHSSPFGAAAVSAALQGMARFEQQLQASSHTQQEEARAEGEGEDSICERGCDNEVVGMEAAAGSMVEHQAVQGLGTAVWNGRDGDSSADASSHAHGDGDGSHNAAAAACQTQYSTPVRLATAGSSSHAAATLHAPVTPASPPQTPYTPAAAPHSAAAQQQHQEVEAVAQYYTNLLAGIALREAPPADLGVQLPAELGVQPAELGVLPADLGVQLPADLGVQLPEQHLLLAGQPPAGLVTTPGAAGAAAVAEPATDQGDAGGGCALLDGNAAGVCQPSAAAAASPAEACVAGDVSSSSSSGVALCDGDACASLPGRLDAAFDAALLPVQLPPQGMPGEQVVPGAHQQQCDPARSGEHGQEAEGVCGDHTLAAGDVAAHGPAALQPAPGPKPSEPSMTPQLQPTDQQQQEEREGMTGPSASATAASPA